MTSTVRERVLAITIAGFRYPGRDGWTSLTKQQKRACLEAARLALTYEPQESE